MQSILKMASRYPAIPVAVVDAGESHILQGMMEAEQIGLVEPILIGQRGRIHQVAKKHGLNLQKPGSRQKPGSGLAIKQFSY